MDESDDRLDRVETELAQLRARNREMRQRLAERARRRSGSATSTVFSMRLDRDELLGLETRAWDLGLPPSVLARNLIRIGLATDASLDVRGAVGQVETAVHTLRDLIG